MRGLWRPDLQIWDDHPPGQVCKAANDPPKPLRTLEGRAPHYSSEREATSKPSFELANCNRVLVLTSRLLPLILIYPPDPSKIGGVAQMFERESRIFAKNIWVGNLAAPYKIARHEGG